MRMRGFAAAVAGTAGAGIVHGLDVAGLLPGVHETTDVRTALGPMASIGWLVLAGGLAWLAARTRPAPVGAASALVVSAVPELLGRHDLGAIVEPGAIAGALVQWLLLLAVIALAVLVDRYLHADPPSAHVGVPGQPAPLFVPGHVTRQVGRRARPRAPPALPLPVPCS